MLKQPTVTKLVNDAERDGLIRKQIDPGDGRRLNISLAPAGRPLVKRLLAEAREAEARTVAQSGSAEIAELKSRLKNLIDRFES